jgi:class 3 adenylate cyclase
VNAAILISTASAAFALASLVTALVGMIAHGSDGNRREAQPKARPGVVTFLLTDIEGSSRLWESHPNSMRAALETHDQVVSAVVDRHDGVVLTAHGEGDSMFAIFALATQAVTAAYEIQRALQEHPWPAGIDLRLRIAVHTGEASGDYRGTAANRCARVRGLAKGGEVLLTAATVEMVQDELPTGGRLRFRGEYRLRDLKRPEHVFQLLCPGRH